MTDRTDRETDAVTAPRGTADVRADAVTPAGAPAGTVEKAASTAQAAPTAQAATVEKTAPTEPAAGTLTEAEKEQAVKAARHNDLRLLIGVLFIIYGVIVALCGVIDPAADVAKTGGIQINLWSGIGMLIFGGIFLVWDILRPLPAEDIIASAEESARQAALKHEAKGGVASA